jgi:hypothetical protein
MVGPAPGVHPADGLAGGGDQVLTVKSSGTKNVLLAALFLLGLSGLLMHLRVHPLWLPSPGSAAGFFQWTYLPATLFSLVDVFLVTALFLSRRTSVYGHLLNGFLVIYGTVLMAHFSIVGLAGSGAAPLDWVMRSTLPDIGIAWADFLVGHLLHRWWIRSPV